MKYSYLGAFILLSFAFPLFSQDINLGPRATALGNTGVALQDVWSLQSNQAGLTTLKRAVASISYRNSFLNPDLNTQSAIIAIPTKKGVFGLSLQTYGFSAYSEQKVGFSYAKAFGKSVSTSLNFNIHQVKIQQYGSAKTFSVDAGIQYKPSDKLILGTHISNPYQASYNREVDAMVPLSIEFGMAYTFSDKLLMNTGVVKSLNSETDIRLGLEYSLLNCLALRGGLALKTFRQFAGFGYSLEKLRIDAAVTADANLGYSPQLALSYEF